MKELKQSGQPWTIVGSDVNCTGFAVNELNQTKHWCVSLMAKLPHTTIKQEGAENSNEERSKHSAHLCPLQHISNRSFRPLRLNLVDTTLTGHQIISGLDFELRILHRLQGE